MSTVRTTVGAAAKVEASNEAGAEATRRAPDVWVLPMARILEIVRGTAIDTHPAGAVQTPR